ncbi:MAG: SDR family NAD(P)-dependent oxidoreductase [Candidatus Pacebacteria bacterium]|nr:SDR family NAD(P)-dependent oxidoreductase [Candidatus Paceibacterota bacterium]
MKTILITSISRGIGKALTQKFLAEGHRVIGTHFSPALDYSHEHLTTYPLDLTQHNSIESCAQTIRDSGATIDILINNAGTLIDNDDTSVILDKLRQTLEINLIGTIDFTENMLSSLSSNGHIVNIASSAGSLAGATDLRTSHYPYHYPSYKISKAALNMYTRTLALRLTHEGSTITVSSVHPGWVKTDMGGEDAPMTPEEAAEHIYTLALSKPETGQFWFKGEKYPW